MSDRHLDRALLVGILALQMNFIDRDQWLKSMRIWSADKSRRLEEILVDVSGESNIACGGCGTVPRRFLRRPEPTARRSSLRALRAGKASPNGPCDFSVSWSLRGTETEGRLFRANKPSG